MAPLRKQSLELIPGNGKSGYLGRTAALAALNAILIRLDSVHRHELSAYRCGGCRSLVNPSGLERSSEGEATPPPVPRQGQRQAQPLRSLLGELLDAVQ